MNYKWMGALLIVLSCGGFGMGLAASQHREEAALRQLVSALDLMECELQYRMTPLPELCRLAGRENRGCIRKILLDLARELDEQIAPDVSSCMKAALGTAHDIPAAALRALDLLGQSLGRFDLQGQLKGLEAVRSHCRLVLEDMTRNKQQRLRSYQTLGFCAGAALAILLV